MIEWPYVGAEQAHTKFDARTGERQWHFQAVHHGVWDYDLSAFDKATGTEVWRGATPFPTKANPMTYRARSGRQFVVIATGTGSDAALVAFARPK